MTIETALFSYLSTHAGLKALVGKNIVPGTLTDSMANQAAVTYVMIDDPPVHLGGADAAIHHPRFQFSCWGTSYTNACAVAAQIKAALQDYSGTMGGESGVVVQRIFYEDANDLFEVIGTTVTKRSGRALDFIIWHE